MQGCAKKYWKMGEGFHINATHAMWRFEDGRGHGGLQGTHSDEFAVMRGGAFWKICANFFPLTRVANPRYHPAAMSAPFAVTVPFNVTSSPRVFHPTIALILLSKATAMDPYSVLHCCK